MTLVDRSPGPHPDASSTDISKMVRMDYGSDVFYHEFADEAIDGWERWNAEWPRPLYHEDGFLVLQGFEHGRAFSFLITEKTGRASIAVARDGLGVSVFGACTPMPARGGKD